MVQGIELARHLLHKAAPTESEEADCLCNMRLQKLLYYVQGWHLGIFGTPLFDGRIEAWPHGPVVKDVYPVFKQFGYQGIPVNEGSEMSSLSARDRWMVEFVWSRYGKYSASELRRRTHRESPWLLARIGLGENAWSEEEVSHHSMRSYFSQQYTQMLAKQHPSLDLAAWSASMADVRAGRYKSARAIRDELQHRRAGLS